MSDSDPKLNAGALLLEDAQRGGKKPSRANPPAPATSESGSTNANRSSDSSPRDDSDPALDDEKADRAADVLDDLLDLMDFDVDVEIREDGERIVLDLLGPDAGMVIGKKGQTLDALQFLVNKIVNRDPEGRRHVILDSGDYRERHDKSLENMARREAKRAVAQGKVITLRPMNARDRRVIHLSLAKLEDVTTSSQGEGARRRVQIIPSRD